MSQVSPWKNKASHRKCDNFSIIRPNEMHHLLQICTTATEKFLDITAREWLEKIAEWQLNGLVLKNIHTEPN